jgi:hypothetical protein
MTVSNVPSGSVFLLKQKPANTDLNRFHQSAPADFEPNSDAGSKLNSDLMHKDIMILKAINPQTQAKHTYLITADTLELALKKKDKVNERTQSQYSADNMKDILGGDLSGKGKITGNEPVLVVDYQNDHGTKKILNIADIKAAINVPSAHHTPNNSPPSFKKPPPKSPDKSRSASPPIFDLDDEPMPMEIDSPL